MAKPDSKTRPKVSKLYQLRFMDRHEQDYFDELKHEYIVAINEIKECLIKRGVIDDVLF